jgi:hypothetical protein
MNFPPGSNMTAASPTPQSSALSKEPRKVCIGLSCYVMNQKLGKGVRNVYKISQSLMYLQFAVFSFGGTSV